MKAWLWPRGHPTLGIFLFKSLLPLGWGEARTEPWEGLSRSPWCEFKDGVMVGEIELLGQCLPRPDLWEGKAFGVSQPSGWKKESLTELLPRIHGDSFLLLWSNLPAKQAVGVE